MVILHNRYTTPIEELLVKNEPNPVAMSKSITSLTRLANRQQITIYLIEQQLKARRFFDDLESIGLGPYDFEPNLDHLILKNVGFDDGTDSTYSLYAKLIDKHSQELKPEFGLIHKQAKKMYNELMTFRKQLRKKERGLHGDKIPNNATFERKSTGDASSGI